MHWFWMAIVLLTGSLGLVAGTAVGSNSGFESAEARIAEACRQTGAFTVKRSGFTCARKDKE